MSENNTDQSELRIIIDSEKEVWIWAHKKQWEKFDNFMKLLNYVGE